MHLGLCLALFVSFVLATDFTCNVQYRNLLMKNGVVNGNIQYSSSAPGRMLISFPGTASRETLSELYEFNGFNGYNGKSPLPYSNQLIFTSGTSCACETGYASYALPLLAPDSTTQQLFDTLYQQGGKDAAGCDIYTLRSTPLQNDVYATYALNQITVALTEVHLDSNKLPCYAAFSSGKRYTFSGCQATTLDRTNVFKEPSGCKCGKPLDIVIVLDRSSSISVTEFKDEKKFVQDFVSQFTFGPMQANLAIVNFKNVADVALSMTEGVSQTNVQAAVNGLGCTASCDSSGTKCQPNVPTSCCCCCDTCIACGMRLGADQLALGRSFAFKLVIVVTDGYGNTLIGGDHCGSNAACNQALIDQLNYIYLKAGGTTSVATYAIGVGADRQVSMEQLTIVAGNQPDHVLRVSDWVELAANNIELIARACDENQNPCGGPCCGFCSCGKCQPVDSCDSSSVCVTAAVPAGGFCCADAPVDCSNMTQSDPCNMYTCDNNANSPTAGRCVITSSVDCGRPADPTCFNRTCNRVTGLCQTVSQCTGMVECTQQTSATDCNDNNMCTTETCTSDGACVWSSVNCSTQLTPNKCQILGCTPTRGCYLDSLPASACDDNNNCTVDSCDPQLGCVHTNITCNDNKNCTVDTCDPVNGCQFVPVVCASNGTCSVSFCEPENGTCSYRAVPCGFVFPTEAVVGASLTVAAIVGIVIAAVLFAAGVAGGGAYAIASGAGSGVAASVSNNPLYVQSGTAGANPLYNGGRV